MKTRVDFPFIMTSPFSFNSVRSIRAAAFFLVVALSVTITCELVFENSAWNTDIRKNKECIIREFTREDEPEMTAGVTPREGTNTTMFNFTLIIEDASDVSSVRLKIPNLLDIGVLGKIASGSNTTFWYRTSFSDLTHDTYAFSFEIRISTEIYILREPEMVFTISPIVSFAVTPFSGAEGTVFTFNMRYRDPGGNPPSYVLALIDNTSNYEMIKATYPENFANGVNYTVNSLDMGLEPGIHTYYPLVSVNGKNYSEHVRYKTFVVLDEIEETTEEKWYEDESCLFPLIFMMMLLLFSIINNLIMRSKMKKRRMATTGLYDGSQGLGSNRCSNCNSLVADDDTFCPHCGEYFDEETVCPECGNMISGEGAVCEKCGTTVQETKKNENILKREKWKDDIRKVRVDGNRVRRVRKARKTNTVKEETNGFMCSMCGAAVKGSASKCNECGTELE